MHRGQKHLLCALLLLVIDCVNIETLRFADIKFPEKAVTLLAVLFFSSAAIAGPVAAAGAAVSVVAVAAGTACSVAASLTSLLLVFFAFLGNFMSAKRKVSIFTQSITKRSREIQTCPGHYDLQPCGWVCDKLVGAS